MAVYVSFRLTAKEGDHLRLMHGEVLDENGNFTRNNFQPGSRHKEGVIRQEINYFCKDGFNEYKPSFTVMGFRYVKVESDADLTDAVFTAHAVYSEMKVTAEFYCSDERVNQLFRNSIWSQKGNFLDIPTDCPTRERAGWTGDVGIFIDTGLTLMDSYPDRETGRLRQLQLYTVEEELIDESIEKASHSWDTFLQKNGYWNIQI